MKTRQTLPHLVPCILAVVAVWLSVMLSCPVATYGQPALERLPPIDEPLPAEDPPLRLDPISATNFEVQPLGEAGGQPFIDRPSGEPISEPPNPFGPRPGMFQKLGFSSAWLGGGDGESLGFHDLEVWSVFALPFFGTESPFLVTPGFGVHYVDGPDGTNAPDLPPRLYDAYTEVRWIREIGPYWKLDVAATPGVYSDFERGGDDAFRVPARILGVYEWTPVLSLVGGVMYLDRNDVDFLPAAGLIWTPNDDTRLDLLLPKPRFLRRYSSLKTHGLDAESACTVSVLEWWWYVGGEFGGGQWAIEREDGTPDDVSYQDYRVLFGIERKQSGGLATRLEVGYVFGRELEYETATPAFEPDGTIMLRADVRY